MLKHFGADRVLEPKGYIPTAAWKIDNSRELRPKEIRIRLTHVKLEELNFRQLCHECNYDRAQIADKIIGYISKRGKLHNPITDSAGICCGVVDAMGEEYSNPRNLLTGEKVICATSLTSIPIFVEEIISVDFNHALVQVRGYAIAFESSTVVRFPQGLEVPYTMVAMDEIGSLKKAYNLAKDAKRILILGDGLLTMALYAAVVRSAVQEDGYVIAVMDRNSMNLLSRDEIRSAIDPYVDEAYFTDILQPVRSYEKLYESESQPFDLSINCANMLGGEVLGVMLTRNKGAVYFTSLVSNLNTAMLFAEAEGREIETIALEYYTDGFEKFTEQLIRDMLPTLAVVERIYGSHEIIKQLPVHASEMLLEQSMGRVDDFVYGSPKTKQLLTSALNIASYDCNVIIEGETGVGKEKILEVIYKNCSRRTNPCIKINCATILENLAESEFFGHEPNSFTGAGNKSKPGFFDMAHTGILFLDEIGTLSLNLQTKLLRVLQEKQFYRVGGQKPINVDVRVICANNVSLRELVKQGKFREDLYYRLSVCEIYVPPLRERVEDITCLAESFLKTYNRQYGIHKQFEPDSMQMMERYVWPGNVRELDNVVHRLAVNVKKDYITETDVVLAIRGGLRGSQEDQGALDAALFRDSGLKSMVDDVERDVIASALKEYGSTRAAAKALKISQSQIMRKKKKYNL